MMFGTWLHINIPRNNQYKWVYISKSGICLVIFLPWHSFYKHWNLKTQSSQIDFKLSLASSSPCPWACARLCNKKRPLMSHQLLTTTCNSIQLCHPQFFFLSFSTLHPQVFLALLAFFPGGQSQSSSDAVVSMKDVAYPFLTPPFVDLISCLAS